MIAVKISTVLLLLGFVNLSLQDEGRPKVSTSLGSLTGFHKTSRHGKMYEAYVGIPYAEPPVGELRFQPPQPVKSWGGNLPAMKMSPMCTQYTPTVISNASDTVDGSEDCLYLNVYAPVRKHSEKLLPVMVWIHGGAFQAGSGSEVDETVVMNKNVVFVSINYRLGLFGFLSTGDEVIPGNMGMKDQSLALRWVHDHIKNFGGDPNQVTILGVSAGSVSVHYHYLTKWSAGLFQRGISISGVTQAPWALSTDGPESAKKLGTLMGCPTANSDEMVNCLKKRPARVLSAATAKFFYWLDLPLTPFVPVVEKVGDNPFISDTPINIIAKGEATDVPWISGIVSEEGLYPGAELMTNVERMEKVNEDWDTIAAYLLVYYNSLPVSERKEVGERIRKHYFGNRYMGVDYSAMPLIYMLGDRVFGVPLEKACRLQAKVNKSPVWTYYYSFQASNSLSDLFIASRKHFGVCHTDDAYLVFNTLLSSTTNPKDLEMQEVLLEFYTSFAIEGKPQVGNAKWTPLNPDEKSFRYLHIANPQNIFMNSSDNFAQKEFWNSINFNENIISSK